MDDEQTQKNDATSKFNFKIETYSYDSEGYYLSRSDHLVVTLKALSASEAKQRAK